MDMFPVRVLVETVRPQHCLSCAHDGHPLLDTFAIVSGQTMLSQLVDTVLSALGLPQLIQDSRGLIQINNWKPLSFETITENQDELVANLFKEISSSITLKILTKHSSTDPLSTQCITDLKQRLLKVAIDKQPQILTSVDNHEIKEVIQQMISVGDDSSITLTPEHIVAVNEWLDQVASNEGSRKSPISSTRFNQITEIPRLERWFRSDASPTKTKLISYMHILNGSPYRRANNKVTYQQICNWFSNQRATQRSRPNSQSSNKSGNPAASVLSSQQAAVATSLGLFNLTQTMPMSSSNSALGNLMNNGNGQVGLSDASNSFQSSFSNLLNGLAASSAALSASSNCISGEEKNNNNTAVEGASQIPVSTLPMDIRSKFNCSANAYNPLLDRHSDGERIDGGSESPTGNDDVSVHSGGSENGFEIDVDVKESGTSSPELTMDMSALSPSTRQQALSLTSNGQQQPPASPNSSSAAAAALFSSLLSPSSMSLMNAQFNSALMGTANSANSAFPTNGAFNAVAAAALAAACSSPSSSNNGGGFQSTYTKTIPSTSGREDNNIKLEQSTTPSSSHQNNTARSRLMFDPLSELPILERWFEDNPHPGWLQIEQFTDTLNSLTYRQNYPPISTHNVKIWFKNRRAKCKRLNLGGEPGKVALST